MTTQSSANQFPINILSIPNQYDQSIFPIKISINIQSMFLIKISINILSIFPMKNDRNIDCEINLQNQNLRRPK